MQIFPTLNFQFIRYSHTSHVINDFLILIGGVNYLNSPPGLCFLDLNRLNAYEFDLQVNIYTILNFNIY